MKILKNNLKFDTDSFSFIDLTFEQLVDSDFHLGSRFSIIHGLSGTRANEGYPGMVIILLQNADHQTRLNNRA